MRIGLIPVVEIYISPVRHGGGITGIGSAGLLVIRNRQPLVTLNVVNQAPVQIGFDKARLQLDGLREIGKSASAYCARLAYAIPRV